MDNKNSGCNPVILEYVIGSIALVVAGLSFVYLNTRSMIAAIIIPVIILVLGALLANPRITKSHRRDSSCGVVILAAIIVFVSIVACAAIAFGQNATEMEKPQEQIFLHAGGLFVLILLVIAFVEAHR